MTLHQLPAECRHIPDPERFTYPFCYTPHPLCLAAAQQLRTYLEGQDRWAEELSAGKMMGVLVVRHQGERGFLAAFSGTLGGQTRQEYFVPPVFDLMSPGNHFQLEQDHITAINARLTALQGEKKGMRRRLQLDDLLRQRDCELQAMRTEAEQAKSRRQTLRQMLPPEELAAKEAEMVRESQFQKAELRRATKRWNQLIEEAEAPLRTIIEEEKALAAERKRRSEALQRWLFDQYNLFNAQGERRTVSQIFGSAIPPSGTGDCCGPKLLQAAYAWGMTPICMGEFWIGRSPADEVRLDGHFYPACHSRCLPVLTHMTRGLALDSNPLAEAYQSVLDRFCVQYADESIVVVRKPEGMLSVPGKDGLPSVLDLLRQQFPLAAGPLLVHRLDMDTSGLLVAALTKEAHRHLQRQFLMREVEKTYVAILEKPLRRDKPAAAPRHRRPTAPDGGLRARQECAHTIPRDRLQQRACTHRTASAERQNAPAAGTLRPSPGPEQPHRGRPIVRTHRPETHAPCPGAHPHPPHKRRADALQLGGILRATPHTAQRRADLSTQEQGYIKQGMIWTSRKRRVRSSWMCTPTR